MHQTNAAAVQQLPKTVNNKPEITIPQSKIWPEVRVKLINKFKKI